MRIYIIMIILNYLFVSHAYSETYFASPLGGGHGKSIESPFRISDFWMVAKPSDILLLLDGRYTGNNSMITPPNGLSGTKENPIIVKALNDGKVEIDGENVRQPVALSHNNFFMIEGFNAHSSDGFAVVMITYGSHNVVRRICAWDAPNSNSEIFGVHYESEYNLFEDCAGWGVGRKIFQNSYGGNHATFRRCFGKWTYLTDGSPKCTFTSSYNSYHALVENCIGTWDYIGMGDVSEPYGIFRGGRSDESKQTYEKIYGCIAYVLKSYNFQAGQIYFWQGQEDIEFKDCISYIEGQQYSSVYSFSLSSSKNNGIIAQNLTSIGGNGTRFTNCDINNILTSKDGSELTANGGNILTPSLNGIASGATIIKRYVNGELTNEDLWPWPMNQRIIDAMNLSGHEPIDVTRTIFELGNGKMPNFSNIIISISTVTNKGIAPLIINFNADISGGKSPYTFAWNFGDNTTSNLQNPTHTFAQPGNYQTVLTVTDNAGSTASSSLTIAVTDPANVLSIRNVKICNIDQEQELSEITTNKWYDLYINFHCPNGWEEISFADVWLSTQSYTDGSATNRGGNFYASKNYILSYSIVEEKIWAKQKEGTSEWSDITGILGIYVDDDNNEYEQQSHEYWAKARIRLVTNAEPGVWDLQANVKNKEGVSSDLFQKNITVVQQADTSPPSAPKNLKAVFVP